jgi:hypothetical protein
VSKSCQNRVESCTKAIVAVGEMARMVGLSRARFYGLMGTVFPFPIYHIDTGRPFYTAELQELCLQIRRTNRGLDGKAVLFNSLRAKSVLRKHKSKRESKQPFTALVTGVKYLGLTTANARQVKAAVRKLFPDGIAGIELEELVPRVFLDLQARNSNDRVES